MITVCCDKDIIEKLSLFEAEQVPTFQAYQRLKQQFTEVKRADMRLNEFKARVMSSFVRNKLLNDVYLPMIGDNLAKQMGTCLLSPSPSPRDS